MFVVKPRFRSGPESLVPTTGFLVLRGQSGSWSCRRRLRPALRAAVTRLCRPESWPEAGVHRSQAVTGQLTAVEPPTGANDVRRSSVGRQDLCALRAAQRRRQEPSDDSTDGCLAIEQRWSPPGWPHSARRPTRTTVLLYNGLFRGSGSRRSVAVAVWRLPTHQLDLFVVCQATTAPPLDLSAPVTSSRRPQTPRNCLQSGQRCLVYPSPAS
ncbi:uncharacterized protein V1510DRAFT_304837 [Dipodascopsis tothii]|uniref:uncharacterized protein n=1 Tax=Dipodascopsis tothii TaxID=44089 RepID=UPI0034CD6DC8